MMKTSGAKRLTSVVWLAVAAAVGSVSMWVYAKSSDRFSDQPAAKALIETYDSIRDDYLKELTPEELNKVIEGGIEGMVSSLGSEFSHYDSPQLSAANETEQQGEYFGIGATLSPRSDGKGAVIEQLVSTAPAFLAGLQIGDEIAQVDKVDVHLLKLNDIVSKIRGPKGTKVRLGVWRKGSKSLIEFTIVRDRITLVPVKKGMLPNKVGYVSLDTFAMYKSDEDVRKAVLELKAKGAKKLIFDLRDNGGGFLSNACTISDMFMSSGPIVYQRTRNETVLGCEGKADKDVIFDGPMVVLINRYSASASEIVAGALQDTKRATIIGETSFGKGVGQSVNQLSDKGELALVTFEWLTPNKRGIQKKGVVPDVKVADSNLKEPITFSGTGAKPNSNVSIVVDGVKYSSKADKNGRYEFSKPQPRKALPKDREQAALDLEGDAILKKAYSFLSK